MMNIAYDKLGVDDLLALEPDATEVDLCNLIRGASAKHDLSPDLTKAEATEAVYADGDDWEGRALAAVAALHPGVTTDFCRKCHRITVGDERHRFRGGRRHHDGCDACCECA
jgi:hypothetical protein